MRGLISAFHTLTILKFNIKEEADLSYSLYWFFFVGLFIGFVLFSIYWIWNISGLFIWRPGISIIILFTELIITSALHIDGLSDWADSLGVFDIRRRLNIMKDPHTGTFGTIAIFVDLLVRFISVIRILELGRILYLIIVPVISRAMIVEMCINMPYARHDGTGAPFVKGARISHRMVNLISCLILSLLFCKINGIIFFFIALFTTFILKSIFKKTHSGITGDLLGATNELVTMLLLFIGAL